MTVSSLLNDVLLLAVFLLIGFFIREKIKVLQKLFIPASLFGGIILLILGNQVLGLVEIPESFSSMPNVLVDVVLASLVFGVDFNKAKFVSYIDYSCVTMSSYGMQMMVGVILGSSLSKIWTGLPKGWGVMGVFSFHGGHGTAAAAASEFSKLGVEGNMAVGMVLATFGLVFAMLIGMLIVNIGVRKGWAIYVKVSGNQPSYIFGGLLPEEKRTSTGHLVTSSIGINHLVLQTGWLLSSLFLGRVIFNFVGSYIPFVAGLPSVLRGIVGGTLMWQFIKLFKLEKYVDLKTIKMISSFLLEIIIFTAMATLDLEFISTYIVPILIYTFVMCVLTVPIIFIFSRYIYKEEWFEKACMAFGAATGNTSTGLALVRAIDPDSQSNAGDTHGVYSTIMSWKDIFTGLTPVWLMSGVGVTMEVGCAIMVGFMTMALIIGLRRRRA